MNENIVLNLIKKANKLQLLNLLKVICYGILSLFGIAMAHVLISKIFVNTYYWLLANKLGEVSLYPLILLTIILYILASTLKRLWGILRTPVMFFLNITEQQYLDTHYSKNLTLDSINDDDSSEDITKTILKKDKDFL